MTLTNILNRIDPNFTDVRFYEFLDFPENLIHHTTMNISSLYNDWWDEALNCPENDAFIYAVEFATEDGKVYFLDNTNYQDFTFEQLMVAIQKEFYSNKNH